MHTLEAVYRHGTIELFSPLTAPDGTKRVVLVLDRRVRGHGASEPVEHAPPPSEAACQTHAMAVFARDDDGHDIDWEEAFDVRPR